MTHPQRCETCKFQMASKWVCQHPNAVGRDGDGVGLTEYEKEHVLRMGCASHSSAPSDQKIRDALYQEIWADAYADGHNRGCDDREQSIRQDATEKVIELLKRVSKNLHDVCTEADDEDHWYLMADVDEMLEELRKFERV